MKQKKIFIIGFMLVLIATMAIGFIACSTSSENSRQTIIFNVKTDSGWTPYAAIRSRGNEILTFPSDPTQSNMVFAGWYIDSLYTAEVHEYSYANEQINSELRFYAKFVPETSITNPYTITFNTNGGAVLTAQQYNFGKKLNPEMVTPVKYGHTFLGWYRDEALTKPWNVEYDRIWGSTTLYAKWESTGYVITYMLDGGTNASANPAKFKYETGLTLQAPQKVGYTFEGWFMDAGFATAYSNETLYTTDITVYAKWSIITYTIDYELGEGESLNGTMPSTYTVEDNPLDLPTVQRTNYDFVGWCKDSANGIMLDITAKNAENLTLTSVMREHPFNITYELDGGTNAASNPDHVTAVHRTLNVSDASKRGYTFEGWYTDSSKVSPYEFVSGTAINADITLYAKWAVITYNITWHLDTGASTGSAERPEQYTIEQTPMSLPVAQKADYHFVGWYLDSSYTIPFDSTTTYAQDLDLYTLFVANELLDPDDYVVMSSSSMLNLQQNVVTTNSKNICIPITNTSISSITYNGQSIAGNYIVGDTDDILVIDNSVVSGATPGYKNRIVINYTDSTKDVLYFAVFSGETYEITPTNYYKKSSTEFALNFTQSITSSNIYNVAIDGKKVEYSVEANAITISSTIMDKYDAGAHLVEIATDLGSISIDVELYNDDEYIPYNVTIDIDNYPNVYIKWDIAADVDSYKVQIGTGSIYTSTASATKFNGNCFDATGLLKLASQTFKVIAVKGGVEYKTDSISFGYSLYSSDEAIEMTETAKKYLEPTYTVYGKQLNRYIASWEDAYDLMFYMALYGTNDVFSDTTGYTEYDGIDLCFDFDINDYEQINLASDYYVHRTDGVADRHLYDSEMVLTNGTFVMDFMQEVLGKLPEATKYSIAYYKLSSGIVSDQTYRFGLYMDSVMAPNSNRTIASTSSTSNANYTEIERCVNFASTTHYSSQLPIELNNKGTASVSSSVELYQALEHGYLPVPTTTALNNLYSTIKNVLKDILDENMTEYEQALVIYEWLCTHVLYDHDAAAKDALYQGTDAYAQIYGWSCFYMEGVFNNGLAVCNGIAAAYSAMCNIMGIPCHKVTGTANGGGHAWNEIYIGGSWYISDATWGSAAVQINSKYYEVLDFEYFLMTSKQAKNDYNHIAKVSVYGTLYAYDSYVNPYSLMGFTYNSTDYNLILDGTNSNTKVWNTTKYVEQKCGTTGAFVLNFYCKYTTDAQIYTYAGYQGYKIGTNNDHLLLLVYIKNS